MARTGAVLLSGAILAAGAFAAPAQALPGDLDPAFSGDGLVTTDFGLADPIDQVNSLIALPGGEIVAAGRANGFTASDVALARYLPNGELDPGFGAAGKFTADLSGALRDTVADIVAAPDNSLFGGGIIGPADDEDLLLVKLLPGGGLDSSFSPGGGVGFTSVDVGGAPQSDENVNAIVRRVDGSLVVAGRGNGNQGVANGDDDFLVARFDAAGELDPSFSPGPPGGGDAAGAGIAQLDIGGTAEADSATDLVELGDGSLLVSGLVTTGTVVRMVAVKYTTAGAIDSSYGGGDGIATVEFAETSSATASGVAVAPDGGAYLVGVAAPSPDAQAIAVAKLTAAGTPDPAFAGDGRFVTDLPGTVQDVAGDLAVDAEGRLVVFAFSGVAASGFDTAVLRYRPDGALDSTFGGGDGVAIADFGAGPGSGTANAGVIAPDGGLIAAGSANDDFSLARFAGGSALCDGKPATMIATPGASAGTALADVIIASPAADAINAGAGDDVICGGGSDDRLRGGSGADTLLGELGNDRLVGGPGEDSLGGGDGADRLSGGGGRDRLSGGRGKDRLTGGGGKDRCRSGPGKDKLKSCETGK